MAENVSDADTVKRRVQALVATAQINCANTDADRAQGIMDLLTAAAVLAQPGHSPEKVQRMLEAALESAAHAAADWFPQFPAGRA